MPVSRTIFPFLSLLSAALAARLARALTRDKQNLIYWTPTLTANTPTRDWLKRLATSASLSFHETKLVPFPSPESFSTRIGSKNCTVFVGHIHTTPVSTRPHEASEGAIITSTRDVYQDLVSRYFFRTGRDYETDVQEVRDLRKGPYNLWRDLLKRGGAKIWFMNMEEYDPCELYRYYDRLPGCVHDKLQERAEKIAARIDCVIDVEDPKPDGDAVCKAMGVSPCPVYKPYDKDMYGDWVKVAPIRETLDVHVKVLQVLRDALLKRKCRDVLRGGDGEAASGGLPAARWPKPGCGK